MTIAGKTKLPDQGCRQHFEISQELGSCYAQLGDYQQARACYQKAAGLEPNDPGPYIGAGTIALDEGRLGDAEMAYCAALCLDPHSSAAYAGRARIAVQQNELQQAFSLYITCIELDPDNLMALLEFYQVSNQLGSHDRVQGYLNTYLERHPGETSVMCCLAVLHMNNYQYVQAQTLMRDALALEPDNIMALGLLDKINGSLTENCTHPVQ
jgi:tetratricopeptide (TPR) repeat protein